MQELVKILDAAKRKDDLRNLHLLDFPGLKWLFSQNEGCSGHDYARYVES